jgi:2-keto-3-deoxy-L-rhamnonate aldolase RhmA
VPLVNSASEAEAAVRAATYPPTGSRGVSLGRASDYGGNFDDYFRSVNDEVLVVAQIEHYQAVEAIEGIVAVEGLDAVFLGPYDLSGSMGIVGEFDHPRMRDARRRVLEAGRAAGKAVGIHEVRPEARFVRALLAEGFTLVACSIDTIFLSDSARALVREMGQGADGQR